MTNKFIRNKQVEIRRSMYGLLSRGCERINQEGDRSLLASTLKSIHNETIGFSVDMKSDYVFNLFGEKYTKDDNMIVVMEGVKELITVLKLKSGDYKGEWRVYEVSPYDFETDEQQEAEALWEREAESAYEKYLDYKASFDDPRGQ